MYFQVPICYSDVVPYPITLCSSKYCNVSRQIFGCKWRLPGVTHSRLQPPFRCHKLRRLYRRRYVITDTSKQKKVYLPEQSVILMLRAWAVWERNRIVGVLLSIVFLVSTLTQRSRHHGHLLPQTISRSTP